MKKIPEIDPNVATSSEAKTSSSASNTDFGGGDYFVLEPSPIGFSIKYTRGKSIEITCDASAPDFKPAMFQGKDASSSS